MGNKCCQMKSVFNTIDYDDLLFFIQDYTYSLMNLHKSQIINKSFSHNFQIQKVETIILLTKLKFVIEHQILIEDLNLIDYQRLAQEILNFWMDHGTNHNSFKIKKKIMKLVYLIEEKSLNSLKKNVTFQFSVSERRAA